jgi:hypothetical protein
MILLIGYNFGEEQALQVFHLLGGWGFIFLGTLLLVLISEKMFKIRLFANNTEKCSQCNLEAHSTQSLCLSCSRILKPADVTFHKRDIMKLVSIVSAMVLLVSIQVPVFALTQGSPLVIIDNTSGGQASTGFLPRISDFDLSFIYSDTDFQRIAKQDMSLIYLYSPINRTNKEIWVTIEIASTRTRLHRWETCLISWPILMGSQPQVTQIELRDVQLNQNPPITGRYLAFQYHSTEAIQAVFYWYESATFKVNSTSEEKQVKISIIAYPESLEDLPEIENQLVAFGTEIADYWEPIKTWSQAALLISRNSASLLGMASALLVVMVVLYTFETKRQRKGNAELYQKLCESDRRIIGSVRETEKHAMPTLDNIATTYQKTIGHSVDVDRLLQRLVELAKVGIVRSSVANKQDQPTQIWKT